MLVLDSGGVTFLAKRTLSTQRIIRRLRDQGLWPPTVPSSVLVECLTGDAARDAGTNQFLKTCDVVEILSVRDARRAARVKTAGGRGSAVGAIVVIAANPGSTVITGDADDLSALAAQLEGVRIVPV